jgi:methionine-rich copper-binding protein CopC
MKKIIALVVLVPVFFLTPHIVLAHAIPLACLPRFGISVTQPPDRLICQFSEPLNPNKISLIVTGPNGEQVDNQDTQFYDGDDHTLVVTLDTTKMPQGIYTVVWEVEDTIDIGLTSGSFQFGVNTVVPPTPTPVLPGEIMTPVPVQPTGNSTADLISRFLLGVGVVVVIAVGVLYWRMRSSETHEQEPPSLQE